MTILSQCHGQFVRHCSLLLLILSPVCALADIVFSAKVMGPVSNIYALDSRGEIHRRTDNINWRDLDPDIAADGALVFSSNREAEANIDLQRHSEDFNIYLIPNSGGAPKAIAAGPDQEFRPRFSPDGIAIAYLSRNGKMQHLAVVSRRDDSSRSLLEADEIFDYSWAPESDRLAVAVRRGDRYTVLLASLNKSVRETPLISIAHPITSLSWSPNGDYIAYIQHPLKSESRQLWLRDLVSGSDRRISAEAIEVQEAPAWSPSSNRFVYDALVNYQFYYDEKKQKKVYRGGMQLFIADVEGKNLQLTREEALHRRPIFSPDGDQIAFLYGDSLDARTLSLKKLELETGSVTTLFDSVARRSSLGWR